MPSVRCLCPYAGVDKPGVSMSRVLSRRLPCGVWCWSSLFLLPYSLSRPWQGHGHGPSRDRPTGVRLRPGEPVRRGATPRDRRRCGLRPDCRRAGDRDGDVRRDRSGSGKSVTITTPDGFVVTLTHLGSIAAHQGATIAEGDPAGTIGPSSDPEQTQPYVHLGVRVAAQEQGYVDPLSMLPRATRFRRRATRSPAPPVSTPPAATQPGSTSPSQHRRSRHSRS